MGTDQAPLAPRHSRRRGRGHAATVRHAKERVPPTTFAHKAPSVLISRKIIIIKIKIITIKVTDGFKKPYF